MKKTRGNSSSLINITFFKPKAMQDSLYKFIKKIGIQRKKSENSSTLIFSKRFKFKVRQV